MRTWLGLGLGMLALAGCLDDSSNPPGEQEHETELVGEELQRVVGPAGGTIDGAEFPGFAGVKVVIPEGALSEEVTVIVRAISEATPLPELGEQCGQSYEVVADGASLAEAIEITLPVDAAIVDDYGQGASDVKVWAKDGDDWESLDPSATAEGSVTFELDRFASAAAGVRRRFIENLCTGTNATCGTTTPATGPTCAGPAFCITSIGVGSPPESGARMITDGTNLYYPTRPANNQVSIVRVNTASTAANGTVAAPFTSSSTVRRNPAVPKNTGEAWIGIGPGGNIRFKFDGSAPQAFDTDALGHGGVALSDGTFTRLSSLGLTTRQTNSTSFESRITPEGMGVGTLQDIGFCNFNDDYATRTEVVTFQFGVGIFEVIPNPNATSVQSMVAFPSGTRAHHRPALGRSGDTGFQAYAQPSTKLVLVGQGGGTPEVVNGIPAGVDAIVDASGTVWIASSATPEIAIVRNPLDAGNRSLEMVPLTTAAAGTSEFNAKLPRGIAELTDGRIAVQTLNGEILLLRKPGT